MEAEVWVIRYFETETELRNKTETRDIAIMCPTTPPSYLRIRDLKKPFNVNIMLIQNIAERYEFRTEFAESVTIGTVCYRLYNYKQMRRALRCTLQLLSTCGERSSRTRISLQTSLS